VVVTGGTGFVGATVARALVAAGAAVTVISRPGSDRWRLHDVLDAVRVEEVDIRDAAGLSRAVRLTGPGRLVDEPLLSAAGDAARGAISSLYWAPGLEHAENQRFLAAYRARFGAGPDVAAVGGYDAARVVVEALRQTSGETSSAARLAEAVAGVEFTSPRGPFRFDQATQAAVHDIYVREVKDERGTLRNVVLDRFPSVPTAPETDA